MKSPQGQKRKMGMMDIKSRSLIAVGLIGWVMLMYQNCGVESSFTESANLSSVAPNTIVTLDGGEEEVIDMKPVGVDYSENLLLNMQMQSGVQIISANTRTTYNAGITMIPESGRASSVTAPMWIAITNLSSEVCQDMITQEKSLAAASRRIFPMVDFTRGPNQLSEAAQNDVVRRMARNFWARNEVAVELSDIKAAVTANFVGKTTANDTENVAIFVCSAMLASVEARKQ